MHPSRTHVVPRTFEIFGPVGTVEIRLEGHLARATSSHFLVQELKPAIESPCLQVPKSRVGELQARRRSVDAWLATWGIFRECPVRGWHSIADNFGITVRLPGVPVHRHMGNDILASAGTPIVAPFDGYASSSTSELGGLEVRVTGSRGYVYNAHLAAVGTLGHVRAGTVVGYVGATGDATTAHDHLEWHPYGGGAVDPNPYLTVSCG
jgi:hypothetical protein